MELRERLQAARDERALVHVTRAFDGPGELGYVVDLEGDLLLLLCVCGQIRFDGYAVIRVRDVRALEAPHAHTDFVEEALELRGERVAEPPELVLTSMGSAVRTAGGLFPLVAIHREEVDPEVCHLGAVLGVGPDVVDLIEIDPDADWEEEPTSYALDEITRIEFGGGYEEALALVGGEPPRFRRARHLTPLP